MKAGTLAMLVLLSGFSLQGTESLGQLKPGASAADLLGGRLTVRLPPGAKVEPLTPYIMSAPAAEAEETRVELDAGSQRMVIMTYELFCLASEGIEQRISEEFIQEHFKATLRPLALPPPLKAYVYFPQSPTQNEEANFVMGVYLIRSDSTMQQIAVHVNPEGARESAQASGLAVAICATLREGKRPMNTKAGDRELGAYSKEKAALITVPDGYVVTLQSGPDFVVYHVRKLVKFEESPMSIGVYFGDFPSRRDGYSRKENVNLFGKNVDWYEKVTKTAGGPFIDDDALVSLRPEDSASAQQPAQGGPPPIPPAPSRLSLPPSGPPSFADVFLRAGDVAGMEELKKVAATLRLGETQER